MLKSLLAPTSFATLLGLCPACLAADGDPAGTPGDPPAAQRSAPAPTVAPETLVVVGGTRAGNARAPSYGGTLVTSKVAMNPNGPYVTARPAGPLQAPPVVAQPEGAVAEASE